MDPSPAAPPPGIPQEERVLAGLAHVSLFVGFPVVAPIAIYFIKKDQSRFVAYHALQAGLTHVAVVPLTFFFAIVGGIFSVAGTAAFGELWPLATLGMWGAWYVGMTLPWVFVAIVSLIAGWRAFEGKGYRVPIVWRLVDRILDAPRAAA
jgi:uncharacterized Tic20 family protein